MPGREEAQAGPAAADSTTVLSWEKVFAGGGLAVLFGVGLFLGPRSSAVALLAAALVLGYVLVAQRRGRHLRTGQHEAMAHRQALYELSADLVRTKDVSHIRRQAARTARTLLRTCPSAQSVILTAVHDDASGAGGGGAGSGGAGSGGVGGGGVGGRGAGSGGAALPVGALPAALLTRLAAGELVTVADPTILGTEPAALRLVDGQPVTVLPFVASGRLIGVLCVTADAPLPTDVLADLRALAVLVSLAWDRAELRIELSERTTHDALTGLGNRASLRERLTVALARARRSGRPVGVLLVDLNRFRRVNEVYGHEAGDQLLRVIADRLRVSVRVEDWIGRYGADQFVVVAEDLRTAQDVILIAERILAELDGPVAVAGRRVQATISVGIVLSYAGRHDTDQLLRDAEAATALAKQDGGGRYQLHGAVPV